MSRLRTRPSTDWRYLAQESALILILGYVLLLGGGYTGLVALELRQINLLLIGLVGSVWLTIRLTRNWSFPSTVLDLPLLAYFSVHAVTAVLSTDPRRSGIYVWLLGLYIIVFYLFVDLFRHGLSQTLVMKTLLITGGIVLVFSLRQVVDWYAAGREVWGWTRLLPPDRPRIQAPLGDPNWLAAVINLLWPFALVQLWRTKERFLRLLLTVWLAVSGLLLYLTISQGGWLGAAAAGGTFALLSRGVHQRLRRLWEWLAARQARRVAGILVAVALIVSVIFLGTRQLEYLSNVSGVKPRLRLWRAAWQAFRSSPIWGTGPFTYGDSYLASQSVPPDRLYGVAHSYPINLAAESGLLGLVGLAWLTGVLIRHLGRARGSLLLEAHPLKAGAVAALVGCAVHSQFDSVEIVPSISLLLAMVVAMLLAPDEPRRTVPHVDAWILPLAWALLLATGVWSLHATLPFRQALSAADGGRWEDAASLLDEAARRDPGFGHYRIQAGYAHGMLVHEGDRDHLEEAIAHYRAGLDRFPSYALDAAHLAILYREAGDWDQALTWMERAVDLAPRSPLFTLNLGHLHEQLDHVNLAEQWYVTTLEERPELASAAFWRSSPIRTGTAERWLKDEGPSESMGAPRPPERWLAAGHSALSLGQYRQALSAFKRASDLKPGWVAAQLGQAEAYAGLGEYREAERMLRAARLTGGATRSHVRVSVALARLYYERGDDTKAIKTLESAIEAARRSTMHGEIFRWPRRAWLLFARRDLGTYLLPQLTVITITDEVADWMLELGGWYEETGDTTGAIRVYRELLEEVPDCDAARERLVQLEDPAQD